MGEIIGQLLPLAVGVALSPVPVIAVILMLFTPKARSNSVAFLVGWLLGLTVACGAAIILIDASGDEADASTASGVVKLFLGILFMLLALRYWRSRPEEDEEADMPGWMDALDNFNAIKSSGIAVLLSGLNPKNLALAVAAGATIGTAGLETTEEIISLAVFVLIASLTVAAPVAVYLIMGRKADASLNHLKEWLTANNAVVMAVLLVIFAAKLIGDGISILLA